MKYLCGVLLLFFCLFARAQENGAGIENRLMSRPDLPGEIMVDIGINTWSDLPRGLKRKDQASQSVGIYFLKEYKIHNKISFYTGLGLGLEKIGFDSPVALLDSGQTYLDTISSVGLKKNKLAFTYLDVPAEFRFHPFRVQDGEEGLFVGVGGIFGIKLNAHTKWKYDTNGRISKKKISGKFNLNDIRYGYQIRLGFKSLHLFYKKYLSDVFKSKLGVPDPMAPDGGLANPQTTTIGISITGF